MTAATRFLVGQQVKAMASVQGMQDGEVYVVSKIETRTMPFGTFVTYWLTPGDGSRALRIMNGHLLLALFEQEQEPESEQDRQMEYIATQQQQEAEQAQQTQRVVLARIREHDGRAVESRAEAAEGGALHVVLLISTCGLEQRELLLGTYRHLPSALQAARQFASDHHIAFDEQALP
jgi:hypothetical protein